MRTEISGVNAPVNDKLKKYIQRKVGGLDKYVPRHARKSAWAEVKIKETGAKEKNECTCEVILHVPEERIVVAETTVNMYAAVDIAEEKLKHRLRKYKEMHQQSKLRHRLLARFGRKPTEVEAAPAASEAE